MKTLANIENPTLNDIKVELFHMSEEEKYNEIYGFETADFLEMQITFGDGTMMKLMPTFWACGSFSYFHYTFSNAEYWLDTDDDKEEIATGKEWLNESASRIFDESVYRKGIAKMEVVADGME